jgi:hypothetical protein
MAMTNCYNCGKNVLGEEIKLSFLFYLLLSTAFFLTTNHSLLASDFNSPGAVTNAGKMYTVDDIYNRLDAGTTGDDPATKSTFAEPVGSPASSSYDLNEVMGKAPVIDVNAAVTSEVLTTKKYWVLKNGQWGLQTGTMANIGTQNITPGTTAKTITQGYHTGSGLSFYHSRMKNWVNGFHGVATKYLEHYLGWFRILDRSENLNKNNMFLLQQHLTAT